MSDLLYRAFVEGDDIFRHTMNGSVERVGVTLRAHKDLLAITEEYREKLVELGMVDPPPPTQEEVVQELAKVLPTVKEMAELLPALREVVQKMKDFEV